MRRASIILIALLCVSLTACTGGGDPLGKYANQVEDYKEQIVEGVGKLEDELDELQDKMDEVRKDVPSQ